MIRNILFLFLLSTLNSVAQISNVQQIVENGRIITTYDFRGDEADRYSIRVIATNEKGDTIRPTALVGDLAQVTPGQGRSIWWEPQLEGLTATGWKIALTGEDISAIVWVLIEGGPGGNFSVSATEVTFNQYDKFCEAIGYKKPVAKFGRGREPVINVSVDDASAFCNWLSKRTGATVRLPNADEWEYAARGGKKCQAYKYCGSDTIDVVAWYLNNSDSRTQEVGTKKPNELRIYDMSGNVWEWCGTSGTAYGGSWGSSEQDCRVLTFGPHSFPPTVHSPYIGFRVLQKH